MPPGGSAGLRDLCAAERRACPGSCGEKPCPLPRPLAGVPQQLRTGDKLPAGQAGSAAGREEGAAQESDLSVAAEGPK